MNLKNKKGAVLPFVIIIGTAMLLLCVALLMLVNYSIQNLKNEQGYAQGYINARSAISFAQGILATDAEAGTLRSFYLTGTKSGSGGMEYTANYGVPGNPDSIYASCTYAPGTGKIEVIGFIKTPDYYKYKDIRFETQYVSGSGTGSDETTTTDLKDAYDNNKDKDIQKDYAEIYDPLYFNGRPNLEFTITTRLLRIYSKTSNSLTITYHTNSSFKLYSTTGADIPIYVDEPLTIETSKKGKNPIVNNPIVPGHYHFKNGGNLIDPDSWGDPIDDCTINHASNGFMGGVYN